MLRNQNADSVQLEGHYVRTTAQVLSEMSAIECDCFICGCTKLLFLRV